MPKKPNKKKDSRRENLSPIKHPPHIEPLFWGTGNVLVWETAPLLQSIDKGTLFQSISARKNQSDDEYSRIRKEVFEPMFQNCCNAIIDGELINTRALYGFFPVITDKTELIVLDPSDYHTQLLSLFLPPSELSGGYSMADYFRPEGDVIGITALTLGHEIEKVMQGDLSNDSSKKEYYFKGIASFLINFVKQRIATEMRRGLRIADNSGKLFTFPQETPNLQSVYTTLFEMMSIEERLGIVINDNLALSPNYSMIAYFTHHPDVNAR